MPNKPLVSIILPTYNRADWLIKSISSVISQTFHNWELIVWDDGSKDNTKQVVDSFDDKRIKYFFHQNQGRSSTLNRALGKAMGDYLSFLDDDDQWLPNKLKVQVEIMVRYHFIDLLFTNFFNINQELGTKGIGFDQTYKGLNRLKTKKLEGSLYLIDKGLPESIFIANFISFDSVIIKNGIIEKIGGFDERLRNAADPVLWTALSLQGFKFAFIKKVLLNRVKPPNSLSSPSVQTYENILLSADIRTDLLNKFGRNDLKKYLTPSYKNAYNGLIREYALKGDRKRAFSTFRKLQHYGINFRSFYLLLGAILGPKIIGIIKKR